MNTEKVIKKRKETKGEKQKTKKRDNLLYLFNH